MGGTVDHVLREIEVECLPSDLVETFELDVSEMEIGDTLCVRDLVVGSDFTVTTSEDIAIAHLAAPRVEEEATDEEEEAAAGEESADGEPEVIECDGSSQNYFDLFAEHLLHDKPSPLFV